MPEKKPHLKSFSGRIDENSSTLTVQPRHAGVVDLEVLALQILHGEMGAEQQVGFIFEGKSELVCVFTDKAKPEHVCSLACISSFILGFSLWFFFMHLKWHH